MSIRVAIPDIAALIKLAIDDVNMGIEHQGAVMQLARLWRNLGRGVPQKTIVNRVRNSGRLYIELAGDKLH